MPPEKIMPQTSRALQSSRIPSTKSSLNAIHVVSILFTSVIIVVSALLGAQYVFRYRKYQLTESPESPTHTPRASMGSVAIGQLNSRTTSTSTLISEVLSLVKIRPRGQWSRHSRLRESADAEMLDRTANSKSFR